ncbi:MAG: DUF1772 domain-containing protein [Bradymonadia bacterium]
MSPDLMTGALTVSAVAAALSGGMTLAFSNFIMGAFDRLPASQAVEAMQHINETVLNPLFLAIFIGTGFATTALAILCAFTLGVDGRWGLVVGAALYMVGVVGVTAAGNVPLNNRLAEVELVAATPEVWSAYARPWVFWNHVRTVAAAIASAAFVLAA